MRRFFVRESGKIALAKEILARIRGVDGASPLQRTAQDEMAAAARELRDAQAFFDQATGDQVPLAIARLDAAERKVAVVRRVAP